jgi:IclR family KDG regulon transcriptional repressor
MLTSVKTIPKKLNSKSKTRGPLASATTSKYSVPVVRSTFRILEELSRSERLGLREVTQNTGIPKSTVFRILSTLVELGYVQRDLQRNYRITLALSHLVNDEAAGEELRRLALPIMLTLRDQYGETVNLGVQSMDKVTYLEVVPSEFALRLQESRGASVPAHASALGKAIMAFNPQDSVMEVLSSYSLDRVTEHTIADRDELLTELKRVRNAGYAFDRGEGSMLAVCIGAPILDTDGHAIAAMSISGPASRFNPKKDAEVIRSLVAGAAEVSKSFAKVKSRR